MDFSDCGRFALIFQLSFLRNIVWLMSNLCRNKNPAPPVDKVKLMLPALALFLQHDDSQILSKSRERGESITVIFIFFISFFVVLHRLADAAWAISYITDEDGDRIQAVIENGCVPTLVKLLGHTEYSIIVPALRSVGNIVTGSDTQVSDGACVDYVDFELALTFVHSCSR